MTEHRSSSPMQMEEGIQTPRCRFQIFRKQKCSWNIFCFHFLSLPGVMPWLERDRGEPTAALLPFNSHQISSRSACFVHHSFTLLFINITSQPDSVSVTVLFYVQACMCAKNYTLNNFGQGSSRKRATYNWRKQQGSAQVQVNLYPCFCKSRYLNTVKI